MSSRQLPIQHHLYSSLRGYRTIHASSGLPPEVVAVHEEYAQALCKARRSQAPMSQLVVPPYVSHVHGAPFGVDHAGRPRYCVHSSIFQSTDLFLTPKANLLFADEGQFSGSWDHLEKLRARLPTEISTQALTGSLKYEYLNLLSKFPAFIVRALLFAFLERGRKTLVVGPLKETMDLIRVCWQLIPRVSRLNLSLVWGHDIPRALFQQKLGLIHVVEDIEDSRRYARAYGGLINIRAWTCHNCQEDRHQAYIDFVMGLVARDFDSETLWRFLKFQEADCTSNPQRSPVQYRRYIRAHQFLEPYISKQGELKEPMGAEGRLERVHLRLWIAALVSFYKAGSRNRALSILRWVLNFLVSSRPNKWEARTVLIDELNVWSEPLTPEESDAFLNEIAFTLNESDAFSVRDLL